MERSGWDLIKVASMHLPGGAKVNVETSVLIFGLGVRYEPGTTRTQRRANRNFVVHLCIGDFVLVHEKKEWEVELGFTVRE